MSTLIFDIATVANDWGDLSLLTTQQLTQYCTEDEARDKLSLQPTTGQVVAIGIYDVERHQQMVYVIGGNETEGRKVRTEQEMLEDFWEGARSYDVFVTYGGMRFDVPFLLLRSLKYRLTPTVEFSYGKVLTKQQPPYHVDLKEQLLPSGTMRPVTLHQLCELCEIESPDSVEVNGGTVGELFQEKKFTDLGEYMERNLTALSQLYDRWYTHLSPQTFKNILL